MQVGNTRGYPANPAARTPVDVTLNANHPMAGESLHFDILIEGVRAATDDEIAIAHAKMNQDAN